MRQLSLKRPIIFFDLETTGLDPAKDRIVEIACIKLMPGGERETYAVRINPGVAIPADCTAIHGISDADVAGAPAFKEIAHTLHQWMLHCDLGGYNSAKFDLPLLAQEFARAGVKADFENTHMVDVQHIFYRMEQRTLSAAYRFFCDKELERAHSAEADIHATIEILEAQLHRYEQHLSSDVAELCAYLSNGDGMVDIDQKMVMREGRAVFNFGKHKGRPVEEVLTAEPHFYHWMMSRDFSESTKQKLTEIFTAIKPGKLQKAR